MSRRAWLTPDDVPGVTVCRPCFIPSGLELEAAFRGAFLLLCDPENWEEHGDQTPEDIAAAFEDAYFETVDNWEGSCRVHYVGEIYLFSGNTYPDGALLCNGGQVSQTTYPALYNVIGSLYGSADAGMFRLPDLRARMPIGANPIGEGGSGPLMGASGGEATHVLTVDEMPNHQHSVTAIITGGGTLPRFDILGDAATVGPWGTSGVGGGQAHNNVPPYLAIRFLIQAE